VSFLSVHGRFTANGAHHRRVAEYLRGFAYSPLGDGERGVGGGREKEATSKERGQER
jgi:hypothetical protein